MAPTTWKMSARRNSPGAWWELQAAFRFFPKASKLRKKIFPVPPSAGEEADWYPEDATVNIWSTDAGESSEFLVAALHENGIHCRVDQQGIHAKLYVLPADATRAREIIREIAESEPPM